MFEQCLLDAQFVTSNPAFVHSIPSNPPFAQNIHVRGAWRRNSTSGEDVIAVGLANDDERFDYVAWLTAHDQNRSSTLMNELIAIDRDVRAKMQSEASNRYRREQATYYRRSFKDMISLSPFAVGGTALTFVADIYRDGLGSQLPSILPTVLTIAFYAMIGYFAFPVYYLIRLTLSRWI